MNPNTFPTKGNLILAKNSLALASQGYELMDKKRNILLRELMLVESQNHKRICTLADGTALETSDTLASLLGRLNGDARFFSPHRAYIVNLDYISSLSTAELLLSDGRRVPVSRKLSAALREAYTKYVF